jgi:hypothetical protein
MASKTKKYLIIIVLSSVGLAIIAFFIFNKNKFDPATNSELAATRFTLTDIELNEQRGFNVSVRIAEKVSEDELRNLAQRVKKFVKAVSEKGIVFFTLPEMNLRNGAWASVEFTPDMRVTIIGQSIEDEKKIKLGVENIKDFVGLWTDAGLQGDLIVRIRQDKKEGYVFEYISSTDPKPSELAVPLIKTMRSGKTIFTRTEPPGDYFLLEENGNLSVYDESGLVVTYQKLK